jgi:single-strand DNA-binding protein
MVRNQIRVDGRVGRIETRFTPQGTAVANISLAATDSHYDKQTSTWVDHETVWYEISLFGADGERATEMGINKGDHFVVEGELSIETYKKATGEQATSLKIKNPRTWGWAPKTAKKETEGEPSW